MLLSSTNPKPVTVSGKRYVAPAVVYQGQISSRAGSPTDPVAPGEDRAVDPIDLFDDQSSE